MATSGNDTTSSAITSSGGNGNSSNENGTTAATAATTAQQQHQWRRVLAGRCGTVLLELMRLKYSCLKYSTVLKVETTVRIKTW
jgi:hypothetical protein